MDDGVRQLTINVRPVGGVCNLRCEYCDSSKERGIVFDEDSFRRQPRDFSLRRINAHVVFHGGEPLLYGSERLVKLIQTTREDLGAAADIQLQTNGTLLSLSVARRLAACQCRLSISLDPHLGNARTGTPRHHLVHTIRSITDDGIPLGIVSVAHRLNQRGFLPFFRDLFMWGIPYWTINRVRIDGKSPLSLSESDYLQLLAEIMAEWIEQGLYVKIQIQPLLDFLSNGQNRACRFSATPNKCQMFAVFQGSKLKDGCEHLPVLGEFKWSSRIAKCINCSAFDFCGGGCPADSIDEEFCCARKKFKSQIAAVRSGFNEMSKEN